MKLKNFIKNHLGFTEATIDGIIGAIVGFSIPTMSKYYNINSFTNSFILILSLILLILLVNFFMQKLVK